MEEQAKMEYPAFIKTTCIVTVKDESDHKKIKVRINPAAVTSYVESFYKKGEDVIMCSVIYCGGTSYLVDMTIDEMDKMMEEIDRGFSVKG